MESSLTPDHHAKAHCFFKIIVCEISSKSKLMIPEKFVRKYGEELQGRVLLKAPAALPWSVAVQRLEGKVWLRNGWPDFAKFYSLCFGHSILFEYQGNRSFKVVIFDTSSTEIDYPLQLKKRSASSGEVRVTKKKQVHFGCDEACHVGDSLKRKSKKEQIAEASSNMETSTKDDTHNRMKKPIKLEIDLDIPMQQHVTTDFTAKGVSNPASKEEKDRALAYAKDFKSRHPFFKAFMQPSYVGKTGGWHVKKEYLKSYIRKGFEVLILRIEGKTWMVKCNVHLKRIRLGYGWRKFADDNALAVGDVCVFELVKPSKKLINVVIYRAAKAKEEENVNF